MAAQRSWNNYEASHCVAACVCERSQGAAVNSDMFWRLFWRWRKAGEGIQQQKGGGGETSVDHWSAIYVKVSPASLYTLKTFSMAFT